MVEGQKIATPTMALRKFFGSTPGQTLQDFADELKQFTEAEKWDMAQAACDEMGWVLIKPEPKAL